MEGLTQAEIGTRLGLTRLRINRLLGEARDSGLVRVTLNSRFADCIELEDRLRKLGLRDAVIVPTPEDIEQVPVQIGRATGEYLSHLIEGSSARRIAVGWGATLRESILHVHPASRPDISVHSM